MSDPNDSDDTIDSQVLKLRTLIWTVGTVGAGILPIVANPMAAALNGGRLLSWHEICNGGEFFLIGMVVVIASICELLPALFKELSVRQRLRAVSRLLGAGSIAFGLFFFYLLALSGKDPHSTGTAFRSFVTDVVSPAAWLLSSSFAVGAVRLAGGFRK